MKSNMRASVASAIAGLTLLLSTTAFAQVDPPPPTRTELEALINNALPSIVGSGSLLSELRRAQFGAPLVQTFDRDAAVAIVFGGQTPVFAGTCNKLTTPIGDKDWGDCTASIGQRNGTGAYTELQFSKNMQVGNIKAFKRPAAGVVNPGSIVPIQIDNPTAYNTAVNYLRSTFGLANEDIPVAPPGSILPVRSVALGWTQQPPAAHKVPVQKLVYLKRGARLPNGLVSNGHRLDWVPAPGDARVVIDGSGSVVEAEIRNWQQVSIKGGTWTPKSRAALIDEIADDIEGVSSGPIATLGAQIELGAVGVEDEVWNQPVYGIVKIFVAPQARELDEPSQGQQISTGAYMRAYSLAKFAESAHD